MGNCEFVTRWKDRLKPVARWTTHRLSGSEADQQVRSTYRSYRIQTVKPHAFYLEHVGKYRLSLGNKNMAVF